MKLGSTRGSPGTLANFTPKSLAILASLLFLLSASAGCLDVELMKDVIGEIEGEEEIRSKWSTLMQVDGKFDLDVEAPPNPEDWPEKVERVYEKLAENVSDPGTDTPQKVRQVLNEEGVSMKKKTHVFEVPLHAELVSLYYEVDFNSFFTEDGEITPGYFEMRIEKPDSTTYRFIERPVYDSDRITDTIPLATDPGFWIVEISGTGFSQVGLSEFYSGEYHLNVRARIAEDA